MSKIKRARLFLIQEGDPEKHHVVIETSKVRIEIYAVEDYEHGEALCRDLVDNGIALIQLCGAWGYEGAAMISKAVQRAVPIGFVVHEQRNARVLAEVMKQSENPYNG